MKAWYRFQNQASDPTAVDIQILDVIGSWDDDFWNRVFGEPLFGITARAFVEDLSKLSNDVKTLNLHINSPGGDVQGAVNIANALRDQQISKGRTVTAYIDGIAASAASIIAMAGTKVVIADNALMMIHNPWGPAVGNAAELRKTADVLDTVGAQIVASYQWHSSLSSDDIKALMDAETWMTADEAIAKGFATEKMAGLKAAALLNPSSLAALKVPEKFKAQIETFLAKKEVPAEPADVAQVYADVIAAGLPTSLAAELVAGKCSAADVASRIATAKQAKADADAEAERVRSAAAVRASDITAACTVARFPEAASSLIASGMTVDAAKQLLTTIAAKLDNKTIDGSLLPDKGAAAGAHFALNPSAIYAERNKK